MKLFNAIAAAGVIGGSFIAMSPAEAFWGGKAAQQRKDILGRWQCEITRNGKKADWPISMKFKSNGQVYTDGSIKGGHKDVEIHWNMKVTGTWSIPKSDILRFGGGETTTINLSKMSGKYGQDLKMWRKGLDEEMGFKTGTEYSDSTSVSEIITVTPKVLIFEEEGGGDQTVCRK